jgi:hypothetical protein
MMVRAPVPLPSSGRLAIIVHWPFGR